MKLILIVAAVILAHVFLLWSIFRTDPASPLPTPPAPGEQVDAADATDQAKPEEIQERRPLAQVDERMNFDRFSRPNLTLSGAVAELAEDCRAGLLVDWSNRRVLWEKDAARAVPIASMAKMMTALRLMEEVDRRADWSLQTPVRVTRSAAAVGGRQVWLDPRETFTLDELLKIIMIHSANDAAYLIAEFIGEGRVEGFVESMNQRARELGMAQAEFVNPHGLDTRADGPQNRASAYELAWLAARLLEYPRVVHWSSTWTSSIRDDDARFDRFDLVNTNRLVHSLSGVDGMKTGYTGVAGFCLTATCRRDGRRLIAVVTGSPSADARNRLVEALFEWGYQQ